VTDEGLLMLALLLLGLLVVVLAELRGVDRQLEAQAAERELIHNLAQRQAAAEYARRLAEAGRE
jgi:hypothetical protein